MTTKPVSNETPVQRIARRYGPVCLVLAMIVGVGLVVARTSPSSTTSTGPSGGRSTSNDHTTDDGRNPLSFSDARANSLPVTFGPGCDQSRGRVAIPSFLAPECYAQRTGNSGATSKGVTADSVKVVLYQSAPDPLIDQILAAIGASDTPDQTLATYRGYVDIYNRFMELYGRKVELVPFQATGTSLDEVAARADAVKVAEDLQPFAVLGGPALTSAFSDELAARGIIEIDVGSVKGSRFFAEHSPHGWNVLAAPDQTMGMLAEYMGKRLKGRTASHAGSAELQKQTRKFGLIYLALPNTDTDDIFQRFDQQLKANNVELAVRVGSVDPTASAAQQIAKLKEAGVTSVLFQGDPLSPKNFTAEATRQGYFPEWIITGIGLTDTNTFARTYDQAQWKHAFGISQLFPRGKPEANAAYHLYHWFFGKPPPAVSSAEVIFAPTSILFTGLMAAGPDLTPEAFRDGLFSAKPLEGGLTVPQFSFGRHGFFPDDDYNGIDDAVEIWFDPDARGPDERGKDGVGMYRYVDGGKRYLAGRWPEGDPKVFVDDPSAVSFYRELPPSDRPPSYPPPPR